MVPQKLEPTNLEKLTEVKQLIRSVLVSLGSRDVTLSKLNQVYKEEEGVDIPFRDFNFSSLKDFLSSLSDVVYLKSNDKKQLCVYYIDTEQICHITSLVAKEKHRGPKLKTYKAYRRSNPIDLSILKRILEELRKSAHLQVNGTGCIEKEAVLLKVKEYLGEHVVYSFQNLNTQLNGFLHILTHDDKNIYFKNKDNKRLPKYKNKEKSDVSISDSTDDWIKQRTKENLIKLIEKHPKGISASDLPRLYQSEYGLDLEYSDLGFNSVPEFVGALPKIFKILTLPGSQKSLFFDAKKSDSYVDIIKKCNTVTHGVNEIDKDTIQPIPRKISSDIKKILIPESVMGLDDTIDQICAVSLTKNSDGIDVIVSEVRNPSNYWVILRENRNALWKLGNELQDFYSQQNLHEYRVPEAVMQSGLHVACVFDHAWHRAIIKTVKEDEITILFYDYGTLSHHKKDQVYFLHKKFSKMAAQAIPCSLYNIKPISDGSNKWPKEISKIFNDRTLNKPFIAHICDVNSKNNSMAVILIDVRHASKEIYINKWMIKHKLAKKGEFICPKRNITFEHYQKCLKESCIELLQFKSECPIEKPIISKKLTDERCISHMNSMYVSPIRQKEAIKKYKQRLSILSQTSSSDNSIIQENCNNSIHSNCSSINDSNNKNKDLSIKTNLKLHEKLALQFNKNGSDGRNENYGAHESKLNNSVEYSSSLSHLSLLDSSFGNSVNSIEENMNTMFKSGDKITVHRTENTIQINTKIQGDNKTEDFSKTLKELNRLLVTAKCN